MWRHLDDVCDTIIKYTEKLPEGSTVSVGYFSSKGEYGLSTAFTLKKEAAAVKKMVDSYRSDLGCTCFNEVLEKVNEDIKGKIGSLFFFTDGCHNEGPWSEVIKQLEALKEHLNVSMFVGCGYIDRNNMTEMADTTGGSFVHLEDFGEFKTTLDDFGEGIGDAVPGKIIDVPAEAEDICCAVGKQIIYLTKKGGKVAFKASKRKNQVYYCTSKVALGEETTLGRSELTFRALAYVLTQHNKTTVALDILNFLGDKYLINKLYNTYTLDEYAKAEALLRSTAFYSKKRYLEGQVKDYLPADDAFCVMDVMEILSNEKKATLYLKDKEFTYNNISRAATQRDGAPLIYPKSIEASANKLKLHESALNVSLQVSYPASVKLDPSAFNTGVNELDWESVGLKKGEEYPVNCIRNYAVIADAKLNTPKLVVSGLSASAVKKLGPISTLRDDGSYVIDLSQLPLINKTYIKDSSAASLASCYWQSKILGDENWVLGKLIDAATPCDHEGPSSKNAGLKAALEKYFYIKNGSYNPPRDLVESTDFYMQREFEVKFKGFSNAHDKKTWDKLVTDKAVTTREQSVADAYAKYNGLDIKDLQKALDENNKAKKKLDDNIQRAKFAIMLVNRGQMPEFTSRDDMRIGINTVYGPVETKFEVVQKKVKL